MNTVHSIHTSRLRFGFYASLCKPIFGFFEGVQEAAAATTTVCSKGLSDNLEMHARIRYSIGFLEHLNNRAYCLITPCCGSAPS